MTPFQLIVGSLLTLLLIVECTLQFLGITRRRVSLTRAAVWAAALIAVLNPRLLQTIAIQLKIGRGADFLLYSLALCFPLVGFYFLHAIEKQRQQVTRLVRELAIRDPLHRPSTAPPEVNTLISVDSDLPSDADLRR